MIKGYLNQKAVWHRMTWKNSYGEPQTIDSDIAVRWEGKRRLVRDKDGREVVSEARVFCIDPVQVGDMLTYDGRKWPVIAVFVISDILGSESHREVAV